MGHSGRTIDAELAKLASNHNGLVRAIDLVAAGIARDVVTDRTRIGLLTSLQPNVWLLGQGPATFEQQCRAAVWTSDGTLGGVSALVWHNVLRNPQSELQPTIVVDRATRPTIRNAKTIRSTQFVSGDRCTHNRLSVTSIPRTLIDSACDLSTIELERTLDDALLAGKTTITAMKHRVDQAANRSHIRDLRTLVNERIPHNHALKGALEGTAANDRATASGPVEGSANSQITTGQITHSRITRSPAEQRIKRVVLSLDVPAPQFNYRIRTIDGGFVELDLAWPEFRVGLDIDGYRWHGGRFNWKRDLQRDHRITLSGWNVKHIIPEITDFDLLALILSLLNSSMG